MANATLDDYPTGSVPLHYYTGSTNHHKPLEPTEKPVSNKEHFEATPLHGPHQSTTEIPDPDSNNVSALNPVQNDDDDDCRCNDPISILLNFAFLCFAICVIVVPCAVISVPILLLVFGGIYFNECPGESRLPVCLVVGGVLALLKIVSLCVQMCFDQDRMDYKVCCLNPFDFLVNLAILGDFIACNVFTHRYHGRLEHNEAKPGYCNSHVFYFSYWLLISLYILAGLLIIASLYVFKRKESPKHCDNSDTERGT
ncbi:uncharacterized protein LOC128240128 isoform X2 [Mya arenaria]|uniref:uncharacterized protein LOC128240128 isoform X2 n=1 Tax=Mya arenaria TaxID=6604 RepID=UPI0022DFBFF8|nr:uncharacterized protein LOC128240128 isoform X2 [Mya arenaria]